MDNLSVFADAQKEVKILGINIEKGLKEIEFMINEKYC
jgi:hypothetical protein